MGKLILVSGENSSGKSLFAESLLADCDGKRYYIATMIPETEENYARIEKHKKQRAGLGFTTLELPCDLTNQSIQPDSVVLLEDVSNLLANNIFEKKRTADEVYSDILSLVEANKIVVAVTISGLEANGYDGETALYIESLNQINQKLYNKASVAVIMKNKKPVYEKGEKNDIY